MSGRATTMRRENTSARFPAVPDEVEVVIGFSPGSASDLMAAILVPALVRELGRPVRIERIQGEDGARAARFVASRPADGRCAMIATLGTHALKTHFEASPGYDPVADFTPVTRLAEAPLVLATGAGSACTRLADVIAACSRDQRSSMFGASAVGGAPFLATELFRQSTGIDLQHVIYDQTEMLYDDLAAGRIDFTFNNVMSIVPRIRRGELRALAVTSGMRIGLLPDVPTLEESGVANCIMSNWLGLVAPQGLSPVIGDQLSEACCCALSSRKARNLLAACGLNAVLDSAKSFSIFMAQETSRWAHVARKMKSEDWPAAILSRS